ncbi:MAG: hypothetical protein KFF68_13795 [Desulfosarcina sp.]|nr:hypothetical protein [Desulfosarcina sp.]
MKIFFFWLVTMLFFPSINYSWDDSDVHPILSKTAIYNATLTNQIFIDNLGYDNGIEEVVGGKIVFEWIMQGSEDEDKFPRFRNHFHNPIYPIDSWGQAGLDDFWFSGQSSVYSAQLN